MKVDSVIFIALVHVSGGVEGDTGAIAEVSRRTNASSDDVCADAFDEAELQPPFYIQMLLSAFVVVVCHFAFPTTPDPVKCHSWPLIIFSTASALFGCYHDLSQGAVSFPAFLAVFVVVMALVFGGTGVCVAFFCCTKYKWPVALLLCFIGVSSGGLALYFIFQSDFINLDAVNCGALPWIYGAKKMPQLFQATAILTSHTTMPQSKKLAAMPFAVASGVYYPALIATGFSHVLPAAFWFCPLTVAFAVIQATLIGCSICVTNALQTSRWTAPAFLPEHIDGFRVLLQTEDNDTFVILEVPEKKISFLHSKSLECPYEDTEQALPGQVVKGELVDGWLQVRSKAYLKVDESLPDDKGIMSRSPKRETMNVMKSTVIDAALPPMIKKVDNLWLDLNQPLSVKLLLVLTVVFWQFLGEAMVRTYRGSSWKSALLETWNARRATVYLAHLHGKLNQVSTYLGLF